MLLTDYSSVAELNKNDDQLATNLVWNSKRRMNQPVSVEPASLLGLLRSPHQMSACQTERFNYLWQRKGGSQMWPKAN